ncbi:MAG TPA: TVP38/TMEM64 family protein [Humisphaera sp.]
MTTTSSVSPDELPIARPADPGGHARPASRGRGVRWKLVAGPVVLIGMVVGFWLLVPRHWVTDAIDWVRSLGPYRFVAFVGIYAGLSAVGLPTSPLNVAAGLLFGLVEGFAAAMGGVMAASIGCFLVARYLAHGWVLRKVERRPKLKALLHGLKGDETWKMLVLLRLNPVLPAAVASYCFGVAPVRFRDYAAAPFVGNIPLCLVLAYVGSAGQLAFGGKGWTVWQYLIYGLGLASTVTLTVWITRYTKRKLAEVERRNA